MESRNYLRALEPAGAYWTSKKALVSDMMEEEDENERVEGWKEQLREEKKEGGVDLRRQNMVRGRGRSGSTRVPNCNGVSCFGEARRTRCAVSA